MPTFVAFIASLVMGVSQFGIGYLFHNNNHTKTRITPWKPLYWR